MTATIQDLIATCQQLKNGIHIYEAKKEEALKEYTRLVHLIQIYEEQLIIAQDELLKLTDKGVSYETII